jgi:hypothetical protein
MSCHFYWAAQAAREAVEELTYALRAYVKPGTVITVRRARAFSASCYFENFKVNGPHRIVSKRDDSGQWVTGDVYEIELLPGSSIKRNGTNNDGRSLYGRGGRGPAEIVCDPADEAVLREALARAQRFLDAVHALGVSRRVRRLRADFLRANAEIDAARERLALYRASTNPGSRAMARLIAEAEAELYRTESRWRWVLEDWVRLIENNPAAKAAAERTRPAGPVSLGASA